MESFETRRKGLIKTLDVASSMANKRADTYTEDGEDDKARRFRGAELLLRRLSSYLEHHYPWGTEAEMEFRLHIATSVREGGTLPSYPKLRHEAMPDFDPTLDRYRVREKWPRFLGEVIKKRDPKGYDHWLKDHIEHAPLTAELLGELFASRAYDLEIITGDRMVSVYREQHFGSCMFDPDEYSGADYVDWYPEISKTGKLRMVTLRDAGNGTLMARALIWKATDESTGQEVELLDRIYPGGDAAPHVRFLKDWAREQGIAEHKSEQSLEGRWSGEYRVQGIPTWSGYPYVDSMRYATLEDSGTLTLRSRATIYDEELDNTNGEDVFNHYESRVPCGCCGDRTPEDDLYTVYDGDGSSQEVCHECRSSNYVLIDGPAPSWARQEYVHEDDVVRETHTALDILDSEAVTLRNGDVAHQDRAVELEGGEFILREDALQLADGTWVEEVVSTYISYAGDYYSPELLLEDHPDEAEEIAALCGDEEFIAALRRLIPAEAAD